MIVPAAKTAESPRSFHSWLSPPVLPADRATSPVESPYHGRERPTADNLNDFAHSLIARVVFYYVGLGAAVALTWALLASRTGAPR